MIKVKGKVFVFLGRDDDGVGLSVKRPRSRLPAEAAGPPPERRRPASRTRRGSRRGD